MDAIGRTTTGSATRAIPSTTMAQVRAAATEPRLAASATDVAAARSPALAKALASSPPVDVERVAAIKAAIAKGTFPLVPSTIADRLIALKLDWNANDKA
ncbi:flagellar biosynthesis anti-sigma factor FlgM [Sphingomonas mollis]|uniref:Negative regulator of flagellin synthesis n=1 Tax=Sphingomonas mollis TaxID=2795726 RepID=A0ABS0XRA4_9SPHN|nr:flagellar biosynthesis anti-sigma factor FlgM [Sphingomonas sp. BT553]MBJ6122270.1 flagellar biosynthesis anti-sigma factor FlgM [Sphingomonas sp. BT553]